MNAKLQNLIDAHFTATSAKRVFNEACEDVGADEFKGWLSEMGFILKSSPRGEFDFYERGVDYILVKLRTDGGVDPHTVQRLVEYANSEDSRDD